MFNCSFRHISYKQPLFVLNTTEPRKQTKNIYFPKKQITSLTKEIKYSSTVP